MLRNHFLGYKIVKNRFEKVSFEISKTVNEGLKAAYEHEIHREPLFYIYLAHIMIKAKQIDFAKKICGKLCHISSFIYQVEIRTIFMKLYKRAIKKGKAEQETVQFM